jgi:hypothetical protein
MFGLGYLEGQTTERLSVAERYRHDMGIGMINV